MFINYHIITDWKRQENITVLFCKQNAVYFSYSLSNLSPIVHAAEQTSSILWFQAVAFWQVHSEWRGLIIKHTQAFRVEWLSNGGKLSHIYYWRFLETTFSHFQYLLCVIYLIGQTSLILISKSTNLTSIFTKWAASYYAWWGICVQHVVIWKSIINVPDQLNIFCAIDLVFICKIV